MSESRAAILRGKQLQVMTFPTPSPGEGEVLVEVLGCTLCASDLHTLTGRRESATPIVLGHEAVGRIAEWGDGVDRNDAQGRSLAIGDRVTWTVAASCGDCFYCQREIPQKCVSLRKFGHQAGKFVKSNLGGSAESLLRGGLAEHCLLSKGTTLLKVPRSMSLDEACPANCATATVVAAVEAAEAFLDPETGWAGCRALVVGVGMLGLTAVAMLDDEGADVIAIDPVAERRDWAERLGATAFPPEQLEKAGAANDGHGVDLIIECTGSPDMLASALEHARVGAAAVLVGAVFPNSPWPVEMEQLVRNQWAIRGVHNYAPRHLVQALEFLRSTSKPMGSLVETWRPLEEIHEAIDDAEAKRHVRIGVHF